MSLAILLSVTSPARDRPSLASFWNDLPRDGKFLLSTVAIETLDTGLVLPFGFIYLHEVRGFTIETAGSLLAGSIVDVHRPGTFVAIYLGNALIFLAPLAVLLGPL